LASSQSQSPVSVFSARRSATFRFSGEETMTELFLKRLVQSIAVICFGVFHL